MPFLRFSRDKRGYEHVYLVQATNRRGKSVRPRVLYWYRTPPGVRVGRQPFDEDVRKALEGQNPGVTFDWATIVTTPFPPQEAVEPWRERRRAERAARQLRREEEQESAPDATLDQGPEGGSENLAPMARLTGSLSGSPPDLPVEQRPESEAATSCATSTPRRKRRRRGGRRQPGGAEAPAGVVSTELNTSATPPAQPHTQSSEWQE